MTNKINPRNLACAVEDRGGHFDEHNNLHICLRSGKIYERHDRIPPTPVGVDIYAAAVAAVRAYNVAVR
jgi:hypothetical protein